MLEHLHRDHQAARARLKGVLNPKQLGTPVGQLRTLERVRRAAGDTAIDLKIKTGKRGKFLMMLAAGAPATPDGFPIEDGPLPQGAGLMALTASYRIERHELATHGGATLTVSRHAPGQTGRAGRRARHSGDVAGHPQSVGGCDGADGRAERGVATSAATRRLGRFQWPKRSRC